MLDEGEMPLYTKIGHCLDCAAADSGNEMKEINLRYRIRGECSAEGQRCYRAYDDLLQRELRLWMLEPDERFGRFEVEQAYLASRKPVTKGIERYVDAGRVMWVNGEPVAGGDYFLASTWNDAATLLDAAPEGVESLRRILFEVAFALRELSAHSVCHGNLKPGNVLLTKDRGTVLTSPIGRADRKAHTPAMELQALVDMLRETTDVPDDVLQGPRNLLESERRPKAGIGAEPYDTPSVYHLGLQEPLGILLDGLSYAATAGKAVAHARGLWDQGLDVVLDEASARRQMDGITVLPIDSGHARWDSEEHVDGFLDRLSDRALLGPIEIHYRHHPSLGSGDGIIDGLCKLADAGRIRLLVASEEEMDVGDRYAIPLRLGGDPEGMYERIWPGISGSEPSHIPREASAFEAYQMLATGERGGTGDDETVDRSLGLAARVLPGVRMGVAKSSGLDELTPSHERMHFFTTDSRSGKRLWPVDGSGKVKEGVVQKIANALAKSPVRRIHELELLARQAPGEGTSTERLLQLWNGYRWLFPQDDWLRMADCALSLAESMPEQGKRRMILDLLYQGCSDSIWKAAYRLAQSLKDSPKSQPASMLAKGWHLYSSDRRSEARSLVESLLARPDRLDPEKLRLCSRLLCLISVTSKEATLSQPLMERIQDIAAQLGDQPLAEHLLIEKVILLLRKEVRPEYWRLLQDVTPPDDSDPVLGIRYWWLMSLEGATVDQPSPESKTDMLDHAMYLARLIDDRSTVLNLMNNKAISGLREGSLTYDESIAAMRDIGHQARSIMPESMGIASRLNITWKLNTISSSVHLMRMRKAELRLSKVMYDTGLGYSRMPQNAATNTMLLLVSQGRLNDAEKILRSIESRSSSDVVQPYLDYLTKLGKGDLSLPADPDEEAKAIIPTALAVNVLLANGHITEDRWRDAYRRAYSGQTWEGAVSLLRKGDLLDGYLNLTGAWCGQEQPAQKLFHRKPLLRAMDQRYRRAGLVLGPKGKTPLQLATDDYSKLDYPTRRHWSKKPLQMLSCRELCASLAEQMDLDVVRVISRELGEFREVDGYGGSSLPVRSSWLEEALMRARESGAIFQQLGSGWRKGCPRPGLIVAPVLTGEEMKEVSPGETFFSVERMGPGKALPNRLLGELLEVSGFLATLATLRRREADLRYDELTGLLTRRSWMETVERQLSWKKNHPAVIVMVDLDGLKEINDSLGHDWGDRAIAAVAEHLSLNVRSSDLVGRYGGDEFVIFLPTTKGERLRELLEDIILGIDAKKVLPDRKLSISVGYSTIVHPDEHLSIAISRADRGLYKSKSYNRGSYSTVEL